MDFLSFDWPMFLAPEFKWTPAHFLQRSKKQEMFGGFPQDFVYVKDLIAVVTKRSRARATGYYTSQVARTSPSTTLSAVVSAMAEELGTGGDTPNPDDVESILYDPAKPTRIFDWKVEANCAWAQDAIRDYEASWREQTLRFSRGAGRKEVVAGFLTPRSCRWRGPVLMETL